MFLFILIFFSFSCYSLLKKSFSDANMLFSCFPEFLAESFRSKIFFLVRFSSLLIKPLSKVNHLKRLNVANDTKESTVVTHFAVVTPFPSLK